MREIAARELGHRGSGGHESLAQHADRNQQEAEGGDAVEEPNDNLTV